MFVGAARRPEARARRTLARTFPELTQLGERVAPDALVGRADYTHLQRIALAIIEGDERLAEMRTTPGRRRHSFTATE